jgi:hypothetical protein
MALIEGVDRFDEDWREVGNMRRIRSGQLNPDACAAHSATPAHCVRWLQSPQWRSAPLLRSTLRDRGRRLLAGGPTLFGTRLGHEREVRPAEGYHPKARDGNMRESVGFTEKRSEVVGLLTV